ncbi:MAG: hypothetical protein K4304_00795 [Propionicimonas sp.]
MTDVEQQLHDDLASAAGQWDTDFDAAEVLQAGRKARRSQTMRRTLGAAAVVAVLTSVSVVAAPPIIAQVLNQQTVTASGSYRWGDVDSEFSEVNVRLTRDKGVVSAEVAGLQDGKQVATAVRELPEPLTSPVRIQLGKRAVAVVLPGKVTNAELVLWGSGGSGSQVEWMDAFGMTVAVTQTASDVPHLDRLDWVWIDDADALHSIDGTPVARMNLAGENLVVYHSKSQGMVGVLRQFAFPADGATPRNMLAGGLVFGQSFTYQLGLFPAGTTELQLTLSNPKGDWAAVQLSDGTTVAVARVPGDADQVVRKISYRKSDGSLVKLGH